jgi:hypothetical protein
LTLTGTEPTAVAHFDSSDEDTVGELKLSARHVRPSESGVVMYWLYLCGEMRVVAL